MTAPAQSRAPKLSIVERAQRYVSKLDPTTCGQGQCHLRTFQVACVLVQAFAMSEAEAFGVLQDWAVKGTHKWTEHELRHKLRSALAEPGFKSPEGIMPRGCFLKGRQRTQSLREQLEKNKAAAATPEATEQRAKEREERRVALAYNREKLIEAAGTWAAVANLAWLANRSALDPSLVTSDGFLQAMYGPGDKVIVQAEYGKDVLWPDEGPLPASARDGVKFYANPVHGRYIPNPRGKVLEGETEPRPSRKIKECVEIFRFLVLESDKADMKDWLGFLVQCPLRIAAITTSGGRSIHTLVRVDCRTAVEFQALKAEMAPFLAGVQVLGVDTGPMNVLAPTRLPQCWREGKVVAPPPPTPGARVARGKWGFFPFPKGPKLQKLLYLQPEPDGRPITELPELRNVEAHWTGQAAALGDGHTADAGGKPIVEDEVRQALRYYANVSPSCREALAGLGGGV
jgi:hypothetical protein